MKIKLLLIAVALMGQLIAWTFEFKVDGRIWIAMVTLAIAAPIIEGFQNEWDHKWTQLEKRLDEIERKIK